MSKIKRPKVKHSLNSPYKLQWPPVEEKCAQKTIQLLIDSLSSVSYVASNKKKSHNASTDAAPLVTDDSCLKKQLIIGVNAFTRCLERGNMRCGVVCLSAKPALLTGHILMLAATRNCPVMGLYDLSSKLAPALGIKSVLALGFKKLGKDEVDPFHDIVSHLTINCTPLIDVPWLKTKEVVSGNDSITSLSKEPAEKKMKFDEKEELEDHNREETKQDEDENNKKLTDNLYTPLIVKTVQIDNNNDKK